MAFTGYGQFNKRFKANLSAPSRPAAALPRPPIGTYDPSIDASERAAQRGYQDLQSDTNTQNLRAATDYGVQLEDLGRTRDYGLADILRSKTRLGEDVNNQGGVLQRDYGRGLADILTSRQALGRQYSQLADTQTEAANASGDAGGGILAQSLAKRNANEAIQSGLIDTQQQRLGENHDQAVNALDLQRRRGLEDFGTQQTRLTTQYGTGGTDYGLAGQQASLTYQRGVTDRATAEQRAGRELTAYQQDLVPTRYYSAAGLKPYTPPRRGKKP